MGFTATQAVPTLDYDFRPHVDAKGTVPEPSRAVLDQAAKAMREFRDASYANDGDEEKQNELLEEALAVVEELTSGKPSLTEMKELFNTAPRVFWAFFGWLLGQMTNPEAARSASTT